MATVKRKAAKKKTARKATRKKTTARKASKRKDVYFFGAGKADGNGAQKALLGGKGANLAEMSRIGIPVPAGFTITTEVCTYYYENKKSYPKTLEAEIKANIAKIRTLLGEEATAQDDAPAAEIIPLTLREPCPDCGGRMRIIETFRRGEVPRSRAPPRKWAA